MSKTLRDLRKDAKLTLEETAQKLREVEPTAPKTHVGILHLEKRGTDRLPIIRGLSQVYDVPFDEVAAAATLTSRKNTTGSVQNS